MFSSRFFRNACRFIKRLQVPKSEKINYSNLFTVGTVATSMIVYSFSTAFCEPDNIKEFLACDANDITEGTMKRIQIGENEENFIIISRVEGNYYATGGKCSHYGAPLQMGYLDGYHIICPWHAAAFDVRTGEVVQSPGINAIPTYPVIINDGKIIVQIPKEKFSSVSTTHNSKKLVKRDPNNNQTFVVIGGGAAGGIAVETLRKEGFTGRIIMITKEDTLPYDRVMLSKNFKVDSSKLGIREASFYKDYDIEVEIGIEVKNIDPEHKLIVLNNEKKIGYDKLLLATGCSARVAPLYRQYLTNFSNIFTIRSANDHTKIKDSIEKAKDIVIIGAGFLGLEAATCIKRIWPDKNVTIISSEEKPLSNILGSEISDQLITNHSLNGINVLANQKISSINGSNGLIASLTLPTKIVFQGKSSSIDIPTDLIILATGAEINTSYVPNILRNSDGSLRVNSHLQTENSSIYAAGDIAQFWSLLTESRERVEHWAAAQQQGRLAALNMLEKGNNYLDIPFFWSAQFLNISFAGFSTGHDWSYTETKGEDLPAKTARITYFFKGERCIGVAAVNWPGAVLRLKIALYRGLMPSKQELINKTANFEKILEKVKNSNPCGGNCCRN